MKWEEPFKVFSIGHYFVLRIRPFRLLFRIDNMDHMVYRESGTVSGGSSTDYQLMTALEPEENQLYGFLIGVKGPVKLSIKQPPAVVKWGTSYTPTGEITEITSPYEKPNPATFTVTFKNNTISRAISNQLSDDATYKIVYTGYKYELLKVAEITSLKNYRIVNPDVPEDVVKDVMSAWIRGRIPEITLEGMRR